MRPHGSYIAGMTNDDSKDGLVVLKRDGRGRVRSTREQRGEVMAQFDVSGLSGPAFCKVAGINYQTFAGWRKEARRKAALAADGVKCHDKKPALVRFVEAALPRPPSCVRAAGCLHVRLPDGVELTLADVSQVRLAAQLIKALA